MGHIYYVRYLLAIAAVLTVLVAAAPVTGAAATVDAPAPITTLKVEDVPNDEGGSIDLKWLNYDPPADFDHFKIYRDTYNLLNVMYSDPIASVYKASANSYRDDTCIPGTTYWYAVTAVDKDGNENTAVFCSYAVAKDNLVPKAPVEFDASDTPSDTGSSITLDWSGYQKPSDTFAFLLYRSTAPFSNVSGMSLLRPAIMPSFTGWTDTTAVDGTDYYYGLVVVDMEVKRSPLVVVGPVHAYENIPPGLSGVGFDNPNIDETSPSNFIFTSDEDASYVVYVNGEVISGIADGACYAGVEEYVHFDSSNTFLNEGTNTVSVKLMDGRGNVAMSSTEVLTLDRRPAAPVGVSVTGIPNTINTLTWAASTDPDLASYKVYMQTDGQGFENVTTTTATSYSCSTAGPGPGVHEYYVAAVDESGLQSNNSIVVSYDDNYQPAQIVVDDCYTIPDNAFQCINKWGELCIDWHPDSTIQDYIVEVGGNGTPYSGMLVFDYDDQVGGPISSLQPVHYSLKPWELNPAIVSQFESGEDNLVNYLYIYAYDGNSWYVAKKSFVFLPGLSNLTITPANGDMDTEFTIGVDYYSPGGLSAIFKMKRLDNNDTGEIIDTSAVSFDYVSGDHYEFKYTGFPIGSYTLYLMFASSMYNPLGAAKLEYCTGPVVNKYQTAINLSLTSSSTMYFGNKVSVSGAISPIPAGGGLVSEIAYARVVFTEPSGEGNPQSFTVQVPIESTDGSFTASFTPGTVSGVWSATAYYDGNPYYASSQSSTLNCTVEPVNVLVHCKATPASVPLNGKVDLAGKFIPLPNVGHDLSGIQIKLHVTDPSSQERPPVTTYTDNFGAFSFDAYSGLDTEGTWHVFATYSSSTKYNSSTSPGAKFNVGTKAGYAILIEGRSQSGEGLAEHNKTLNGVYDVLVTNRGFTAGDVNYLNYSTGQSWVDDVPSEAVISYAISNWAEGKMNSAPAPLYIFMVGHGDGAPNPEFKIYQGTGGQDDDANNVDPAELDGWIDTLESSLTGSAADEPIYVIYGACYAGSFLSTLSETGKNRVIITSTEDDELSGRQPSYGNPREGEWFINRFISDTAGGGTIYENFKAGSDALTTPYPNQHPLLDDNADDTGSRSPELGASPLDGGEVLDREIGYDTGAPAKLSIFEVCTSITLGSSATKPSMVWAKVSDQSRTDISQVWLEVEPPGYSPDTSNNQVVYSLQRAYADSYNTTEQRYEWTDFLDPASSQIDFSAPGTYRVAYYAVDTSSLSGQVTDYIATRVYKAAGSNNPAGLFDLSMPADNATVYTNLLLTWQKCDDDDGGVTYTVEISRQPDFSVVDITRTGLTTTFLPLCMADGISDYTDYYWRVFAVDAFGDRTQSDSIFNFFTNNTNGLPTLVYGLVTNFSNGSTIDNATISIGVDSMPTDENGIYLMNKDSGTYSFSTSKSGYDTYNTTLSVSGETLQKSVELEETNPDPDPPTSTISYPSGGTTLTGTFCNISGTASDAVSGVVLVEVSTNGGSSFVNATGTTSWTHTWTLPADGTYTIKSRATDGNSNVETPGAGVTVNVDNNPPTVTFFQVDSGATYANTTSVTLGITATDTIGPDEMRFSNDTSTGWSSWVSYASTYDWSLDSTDGTKTVSVEVRDAAGHVSSPSSDTIILDQTPPATPTLSIDSGAAYTNSTSVSLGISSSDTNGLSEMRFSNDTSSGWSSWVSYAASYGWLLDDTEGTKLVHVEVKDNAGNTSLPGHDDIVLDYTPPAGSLDIDSGATYANATSVTLYPSASDTNGISGMRFSNDTSAGWSGWTNYTAVYGWSLTSGDGAKTVYAEYKDPAGNTHITSDTVTLDSTPPTGTIVIDSGATYANTTSVSLTLSASDANGVAEMRFSNSTSSGWTGWLSYAGSYGWAVEAGDGAKTVYGKYRDNAGNESGIAYDRIVLDGTDPSSDVISPDDGALIMGRTYRIMGTADDGQGSGVASVEVTTDGGSTWHAASGGEFWYYDQALTNATTFYINSRATDKASRTETPGAAITATFAPYSGTPENPHFDWAAFFDGGGDCTECHVTVSSFLDSGFESDPGFCNSCHNPSGIAHGAPVSGSHGHSIMASVTTVGITYPSYGNVTGSDVDNRMFANLKGGDLVVCVTCHNPMGKLEDYGRDWELTTTADNRTYTLQNGAWANLGYVVPAVYRDTTLWTGPANDRDRAEYLVDPVAYTFNSGGGFVTFTGVQSASAYIYVTLDYPYLRATAEGDTMCSDCHAESGHMGLGCLDCHVMHGSDNLMDIREEISTPTLGKSAVVFTATTGANSYADGDSTYDGICEVCHETTLYHTYDGSGFANHSTGEGSDRSGTDCTSCHTHASGFAK